jgi:hypothetical protein
MLKKILIFLFIINLNSCGYSPVYKLNENIDFRIKTIKFEGDRVVNNFLKSKFARYSSSYLDKGDEFVLDIKTDYIKTALSKDSTGEVSVYQLELSVIIKTKTVNSENLEDFKEETNQYIFKEEFLLKNDNDKFREKRKENSIKQNLTSTIFDKFTLAFINR